MKKLSLRLLIIVLSLIISPLFSYSQYCPVTNAGGACITNTTFNTINYSSVGCIGGANYTATGLSTALIQGQTYTCTVTNDGAIYGSGIVSIWIDWNQNFIYEATEWYQPYTAALTGSSVITVGSLLTPGPRGMRVRSRGTGNPNAATDACIPMGSGETEDYVINIVASTPCSGTPLAGTAVANPTNACPGQIVNVSLSGSSVTGGLTYQWYRRILPGTTFNFMPGETNPTLSILPPPSTVTQYRCEITCTFSGLTVTSIASAFVNVQPWSPTGSCWCIPTYVNGGGTDYITNVTLGTLTNNTLAAGNPTPFYVNYTSLQLGPTPTLATPTLTPAVPATLTISYGTDPNQYGAMWIDYNHNGSFDTTEYFSPNTNAGASGTHVFNFTPPAWSAPGITRMRIRAGDDVQMSNTQACGPTNSTWGETEDYLVNILASGPYDLTVNSMTAPIGNFCTDSSVMLSAQICNYGSIPINTTTDTVYVAFNISGPFGLTTYYDTLAPGLIIDAFGIACQTASVGPVNLYFGGQYSINAHVTWTGPSNANIPNDTLITPVSIINYRPTAGPDYHLCQDDIIPFGSGLTVSGCVTPILDSATVIFTLSSSGTVPCLPTAAAYPGACLLGTGTLPTFPIGATPILGIFSATNLASANGGWANETRLPLFSGTMPVTATNILHPTGLGNPGLTVTSYNWSRTIPLVAAPLDPSIGDVITGAGGGGSIINVGYHSTWGGNATTNGFTLNALGIPTVVSLKIYYTYVPSSYEWFVSPTAGSVLYTYSPFDPIGVPGSGMLNSNTPGITPFYVACAGSPNCRVPVDLIINPNPTAVADSLHGCEYAPGSNSAVFNLDLLKGPVSAFNYPTDSVEFYGDAALFIQILNTNNDTSSTNIIYSKVIDTISGCYASKEVQLRVTKLPQFAPDFASGNVCSPNSMDIASLINTFPYGTDTTYYTDPAYLNAYTGNVHSITMPITLYMILKTTSPVQCADSGVAVVGITPASDYIASQILPANYSNPGPIPCGNITLTNGNTETLYTTTDCRKIATVTDNPTDLIDLGSVSICEDIFNGVDTHNTQPYLNRSFEITPTNNGKAQVCLYVLADDIASYDSYALSAFPSWPTMNPTTMAVTQVDNGNFTTPGHTAVAIPNASITSTFDPAKQIWTICFPVDSFSYFYIHTANPLNIPLPVTLYSFKGKLVNETSVLNWVTSSEHNNNYFVVERSKDGKIFNAISSKINSKAPNGNSNVNIDYSFIDNLPLDGHNYYRLQQVDIDGIASESRTVDVYFGDETMISLYPNPVNTELTIEINTPKATTTFVKIMDATGRVVRTVEIPLQAGNNVSKIDLQSMADGVYIVNITNNKGLNYSQTIRKK